MKGLKLHLLKSSQLVVATFLLLVSALTHTAIAQKPDRPQIAPKYQQTNEEQERDLSECSDIAKARTGIDPATLTLSESGNELSTNGENSAMPNATGSSTAMAAAASKHALPEADSHLSDGKDQQLAKFREADALCLRARGYTIDSDKKTSQTKTPQAPNF